MPAPRPGRAVRALAALSLFTVLAGDFWRYTISWYGWGALVVALTIAAAVLLARYRPDDFRWRRIMPKTLALLLLWSILSLAWSAYRGATVLGLLGQWSGALAGIMLAVCFTWRELLGILATALRWVLGLSLVFELVVAVFVRQHILPFWIDYGDGDLPNAFYWSRNLLFAGGQIQGIMGNSNLLCMCALLGLIVFGIQLAAGTVRKATGIAWLVVAAAAFALSRSSTVIIAALLVAIALGFTLWGRRTGRERRPIVYATAVATLVAVVGTAWAFWDAILDVFGKTADLTGRVAIWESVIDLAAQRPIAGWGWVSYWAPWAEPFDDLAVHDGVVYLQAHDAWLDVWLQLGLVGVVVFVLLVGSTMWRGWFIAMDSPRYAASGIPEHSALDMFPLLVMAALFAQAVTESRMLIESGWVLLVLMAVKTRLDRVHTAEMRPAGVRA